MSFLKHCSRCNFFTFIPHLKHHLFNIISIGGLFNSQSNRLKNRSSVSFRYLDNIWNTHFSSLMGLWSNIFCGCLHSFPGSGFCSIMARGGNEGLYVKSNRFIHSCCFTRLLLPQQAEDSLIGYFLRLSVMVRYQEFQVSKQSTPIQLIQQRIVSKKNG